MTYAFLLESVWHPPLVFEERREDVQPPELELQALWFSGAFGRDFRTTCGKSVRIVQFGEWNRGSGPDFARVAVEIDGETKTGDLELDPDSASWEGHGHAANPAFANVVLHVVFQPDCRSTFIRTSDHREVPQVVISRIQLADALNRPPREVAIAKPGRCVAPLRMLSSGALERLLTEAATHRANAKAKRFLRAEDAHGRDAALYLAVAETLGYRANTLQMKLLAQRVPLSALNGHADLAEPLLFGTAGFLCPWTHELAPCDTREYLRRLWDEWWKHRDRFEVEAARSISWKTHGQRPANHPHRRIGALAALVGVWPVFRRLALARSFQVKPLLDFLAGLESPFWSHRHTLSSAASSRKIALIGRSHALELVANHLAPLALHEGRMTRTAYHKLRASATNERVKRCAIRLFGSEESAKPWLKHLHRHQALLQIYQDFCLEDFSDCNECPFPEQLAQWK